MGRGKPKAMSKHYVSILLWLFNYYKGIVVMIINVDAFHQQMNGKVADNSIEDRLKQLIKNTNQTGSRDSQVKLDLDLDIDVLGCTLT